MKISAAFPSNYLKAVDFESGDQTLTIKSVDVEEIGGQGKKEEKPIIYFREMEKGLVLNKTNANTIEKLFGSDDTDDWIGKQITIGESEIEFQGEAMMSIRVRLRTKAGSSGSSNINPSKPSNQIDPDKVLQAAKQNAWTIFGAKFSALPDAERMPKLKEIVAATFPGQAPTTLNVNQWNELVKNDFEVLAAPFGDDKVNPDDIPF